MAEYSEVTVRDTVMVRDTVLVRDAVTVRDTVTVRQRGDTVIVERSVWRDVEREARARSDVVQRSAEEREEREERRSGGSWWRGVLIGLTAGVIVMLIVMIINKIRRYVT